MSGLASLKNRQRTLLLGIGVVFIGICLLVGALALRGRPLKPAPSYQSDLVTGTGRVNPQEAWVYQFSRDADLAVKRLEALETMMGKLLDINQPTPGPKGQAGQEPADPQGGSSVVDTVADPVADIRQELKKQQGDGGALDPSLMPSAEGNILPVPSSSSPLALLNPSASFRSKGVSKISLNLKNARSGQALKTVDNTIPAGAFATAVLLGGVDASASIQASSDPRPALLRLTSAGTLPRKFHSDLYGCHALAAAYGDLSSERVYMRLEKLTCMERTTGEIVEVKVQGYVAGEDGRTGIRGSVVDRAGESMRNALVGGFLSGIGDFLSQSHQALTLAPLAGLAQPNAGAAPGMALGSLARHSAGKGASNALEKYADFYIKRAEQVQPVIQVAAGRQVDIVFTEGVSIGDSAWRQVLGRSHDQERYQQLQGLQEGAPQPAEGWPPPPGNS